MALALTVFAVYASAQEPSWQQILGVGQSRLFQTDTGRTRTLAIKLLQSGTSAKLEWKSGDTLLSRELLQLSADEVRRFSYYDGRDSWVLTPAEPILRLPIEPGATWEWFGEVSNGKQSLPGQMYYRVGNQQPVTIAGKSHLATEIIGYGRIGDLSIIKQQLFVPGLGLIQEEQVVHRGGTARQPVYPALGARGKDSQLTDNC